MGVSFVAPRIMVMNHTPDMLELFGELLSNEGYETSLHLYSMQALRTAHDVNPALIIIDHHPLEADLTRDMLLWLKDDPVTKHTPVLIATTAPKKAREVLDSLAMNDVQIFN